MKLCTFSSGGEARIGASFDDTSVFDVAAASTAAGHDLGGIGNLRQLFEAGSAFLADVRSALETVKDRDDVPWRLTIDEVRLHHPYRPRKNVIRAGNNSRTMCGVPKATSGGVELPPGRWQGSRPIRYYTKAPTAVQDPGAPVAWASSLTTEVYAEPQLVIVVGQDMSYVSPDEALSRIAGYSVATDITSNDLKIKHGQWVKAASLDTFFPWGPFIVTADAVADPDRLAVSLRLNESDVISGSTGDAILSVAGMLSELSFGIRLEPGDVLMLGAPECVGFGQSPARWLLDGDVLTSEIEGIGSLSNTVSITADSRTRD
jgi:2-keto-4-pentenoate hydratase/2-oxohepta-3-ene-1,7-dioic acid hydratase in catechol pathway